MRIVFDIGGSILAPNNIDVEKIKAISNILKKIKDEGHEVAVVVGGGRTAREYIKAAKQFNADNSFCDAIGIEATRLNAMLIISALGEYAIKSIPKNFEEAELILKLNKIPVMGGTHPGHTTDAVSAMLAEYIKADLLVIATNVDGVYDKDPKKYKDAKKYNKLSFKELFEIALKASSEAGSSSVVDPLAAKIIERARIRTIIVKGEPENLLNAIIGKINGTVIE
ncbi:UMP kinase [Methanocaldococcus villosus]|uniref:UMP kinase n=1 Tax=Methanocaldococcus villosus TaxID=667126 RepID=UPI00036B88AC|nr:UMP kinase [Methanocaldococcus villosus]